MEGRASGGPLNHLPPPVWFPFPHIISSLPPLEMIMITSNFSIYGMPHPLLEHQPQGPRFIWISKLRKHIVNIGRSDFSPNWNLS